MNIEIIKDLKTFFYKRKTYIVTMLIILIISHHTFLCNNAQKNQLLLVDLINNVTLVRRFYLMERVEGIEPSLSGRKHDSLPLNYNRKK